MILRLSQKLCSQIKVGSLKTMPPDENPFADWSAHLFAVGRTKYIIVSNTQSLLSAVLLAKGITNDGGFVERALGGIREMMKAYGWAFVCDRFVIPAGGPVSFAKALNRSVTGSMNDLIIHAKAYLDGGGPSLFDLGFVLNDILLSALAHSGSYGYGRPTEAFEKMVKGIGQ
jgi:hypothetical protein